MLSLVMALSLNLSMKLDKVDKVKAIILKQLPAVVVNKKNHSAAVSSVYFDNDQFQLYSGRLERSEGAEVL